jgi:hypothetical protein
VLPITCKWVERKLTKLRKLFNFSIENSIFHDANKRKTENGKQMPDARIASQEFC